MTKIKNPKGAGGREEYREIFLKKERQPTGILFREYREDEKRVEKETAVLRLPEGTGFDPTLMIPASWTSLSLEELRQLSIWLRQGRPPAVGREAGKLQS